VARIGLPVEIQPLQTDIARIDRTEATHLERVVETYVLVTYALAEGVFGGLHGIVVGALRGRASGTAARIRISDRMPVLFF
jgi:hypothetical protein